MTMRLPEKRKVGLNLKVRLMVMVLAVAASKGASADKTWVGLGEPLEESKWKPAGVPGKDDLVIWEGSSNLSAMYVGRDWSVKCLQFQPSMTGNFQMFALGGITIGASGIDMSAATHDVTFHSIDPNAYILGDHQTWNVNKDRVLHMSGVLRGSGRLTKDGEGTLRLGGPGSLPNVLDNPMVIKAGVLDCTMGGNKTLLSTGKLTLQGGSLNIGFMKNAPVGDVIIAAAASKGDTITTLQGELQGRSYTATLTSGNAVVSAPLMGPGGLKMSGAGGTLTLTCDNGYRGDTVIEAGTLTLQGRGKAPQSASIQIASGATLDLAGADLLALREQQTLAAISTSGQARINAPSKTVSCHAKSKLAFRADGSNGTVGRIRVTGNVALNKSVVAVHVSGSRLRVGTYRLLECTGTLSGVADASPILAGNGLEKGLSATIQTTAGDGGYVEFVVTEARKQ